MLKPEEVTVNAYITDDESLFEVRDILKGRFIAVNSATGTRRYISFGTVALRKFRLVRPG